MTYGARILNSQGVELASTIFKNYVVVETGTRPANSARPTLAAGQKLLLRPAGSDASNHEIFYNQISSGLVIGTTATDFEYAIISKAVPTSTADFGMRFYDSTGALTFDSNSVFVAPQANVQTAFDIYAGNTFTVPATSLATRKRWVHFVHLWAGIYPRQIASAWVTLGVKFVSPTSVFLKCRPTTVGPPVEGGAQFTTTVQALLLEA